LPVSCCCSSVKSANGRLSRTPADQPPLVLYQMEQRILNQQRKTPQVASRRHGGGEKLRAQGGATVLASAARKAADLSRCPHHQCRAMRRGCRSLLSSIPPPLFAAAAPRSSRSPSLPCSLPRPWLPCCNRPLRVR
jgi:hypothetical protein